ncbi:hypothetical protein DBR40_21435 [Pedobacter sp. KBW01]|uniref:hypothetical protein n=1 Tax=Pedobacter sp. KBW01 TaxID=2153364 RepID=UPI000F5AF4F5|nr:hypothetical protein [Pedobacter sp. KBW01]RQO66820.1 hypothetical protein DBR40_21435 [Pedobacter sp. KBW01]
MKNNKNKTKTVVIILILFITLSNTSPVQFFTLGNYHYRNADNSFTYTEFPGKGLDFETGITRGERFKREHPDSANKTLYRTFRLNPLKFWEWW